jgi:hypothetical protein
VAPAVAGAAVVAIGAGLLWVQGQLARKRFQESLFMNDYPTDALYRRPSLSGMSDGQLQHAKQALDYLGRDSYLSQPGSVMIERRDIDRELMRRSGRGGFLFVAPDVGMADDAITLVAGAAAVAAGVGGEIWSGSVWLGTKLGTWGRQLWGWLNTGLRGQRPAVPGVDLVQRVTFSTPKKISGWIVGRYTIKSRSCTTNNPVQDENGPALAHVGPATNVLGIELESTSNQAGWDCGLKDLLTTFLRYRWIYEAGPGSWMAGLNISGTSPGKDYGQHSITGGLADLVVNDKPYALLVPGGSVTEKPRIEVGTAVEAALPELAPRRPAALPPSLVGADTVAQPEIGTAVNPALPRIAAPPTTRPAKVPGAVDVGPNGVAQPVPLPTPTTPPGAIVVIPGTPPVVDNGPQATMQGIATEVGRLEQKLERLLNPTDPAKVPWAQMLFQAAQLLTEQAPGALYRLKSVCEVNAEGEPIDRAVEVGVPGGAPLSTLMGRVDALADLMQGLKDFRQPVCDCPKPEVVGELVTVNFRSLEKPPGAKNFLRKQLRYRDQTGSPEATHIAHWLGFQWAAGPAIVASKGASWGIVQVWAATPAEGRRVLQHAASVAGVDLSQREHKFVDSASRDDRWGKAGTMRVEHTLSGTPCISKRPSADGPPTWRLDP